MDPFENNDLIPEEVLAEPEAAQEPVAEILPEELPAAPEVPAQPRVARKVSPYADSPYVMQHAPAVEPVTAKPKKAPRPKKERKPLWRNVLAAVLVLALVVSSCWVTATLVNMRWDHALYETEKDFNRQIEALQQQIEMLTLKKEHLENLIQFARGIKALGVRYMDFSAFDTKKLDEYAAQAKEYAAMD